MLFRVNLSLYAAYARDFQTAEQEARALETPEVYTTLALALAQMGQGQFDQAQASYEAMGKMNALGASIAASGLGDLASMQGHFGEAVQILEKGVAADLASKGADRAAAKLMAIAHAQLSRGRAADAVPLPNVRYRAARASACDSWPAARSSRLGTSGRLAPLPIISPRNCRPSRKPTRKSSRGSWR